MIEEKKERTTIDEAKVKLLEDDENGKVHEEEAESDG